MGIEWSAMNVIASDTREETETKPDGTVIVRKQNPWIRGLTIVAATTVLVVTIDGGTGIISHTVGRKCISCNSKI